MAGTVTDQGATLLVEGDWGLDQFTRGSGSETLIDCTGATFVVQSDKTPKNLYPVYLKSWANTFELRGGTINGTLSLTMGWGTLYNHGNSASVFYKGGGAVTISDWQIDRPWDGIRVAGGASSYIIEDCHVSRARDDAVEVDEGMPGTIRDCLFEDVFLGISTGSSSTPSSANTNTVTMQNVLVKMSPYNYQGVQTHGGPLKADQNGPKLVITNCVFAISKADHDIRPRLELAFGRVQAASSGNYYLNLSDDPLPGNYPTLPPSFTYLEGAAARQHWESARAAYFGEPVDPPPPEPDAGEIIHVIKVNPDSGAIQISTANGPFVAPVEYGATNGSGADTSSTTLTVIGA